MANADLRAALLIIGAGPYGLAVASYARQAGVDFLLLGKPLEFFEQHTPTPMVMATSYETAIKDPSRKFTLRRYCGINGIPLPDTPGSSPSHFPPRHLFLDYARSWVNEVGLQPDPRQVATLRRRDGGCEAILEDGTTIEASNVVLATGLFPHRFIPPIYPKHLPREVFSHNTEAADLKGFTGKRILVVGGGFSGVEWAIYLSEVGAEATCIYRGEWIDAEQRFGLIVAQWRNLAEADHLWWQRLSQEEREQNLYLMKVQHRNGVPPWLKGRETKVRFLPKTDVQDCQERGGRVLVTLTTGERLEVDHIVLGTGFRPDVSNLEFLDKILVAHLQLSDGFPVLDDHFQSSVPRLYFVGALTIKQFGPVLAFVSGSGVAPPHILKHILSSGAAIS